MTLFIYLIPVIIFLNRFLIPDYSFDTLNYHLFLGSRGLTTNIFFPYLKEEFFPTGYHNFPPLLDAVNFWLINLVGYRLGTITSLISYLGINYFIIKIYEKNIREKNTFIKLLDLFIITTLGDGLFLIASYYIDVTIAFLLLLGLYFFTSENKLISKTSIFIMGLILYIKLTTIIFFLPFLTLYYWKHANSIKDFFISSGFVFISLIMFFFWLFHNYHVSGNPIFPYYNAFFKSPYALPINFKFNFGGKTITQKALFPFYSLFHPETLGENNSVFPNMKLNIYFWGLCISMLLVLLLSKNLDLDSYYIILCVYFFSSYFLWAFLFGYLRYALFLELLGGFIFVSFNKKNHSYLFVKLIMSAFYIILLFYSILLILFNLKYDISWRPPLYKNLQLHFNQFKYLFKKRFDVNIIIKDINYLLNCRIPSTGYVALIDNLTKIPVVNIDSIGYPILLKNKTYAYKNKNIINNKKNRFLALTTYKGLDPTYKDCMKMLAENNLFVIREVSLDNFLGYKKIKIKLLYIKPR